MIDEMINESSRPLIACITKQGGFADLTKSATVEIGGEFWCSEDPHSTFRECKKHHLSCVVVDFDSEILNEFAVIRNRGERPIIAVVPHGNVHAAFRAAGLGAVNVIEKPLHVDELVVNLRTALASETRMGELLKSDQRFSGELFDYLTKREKAILGLLMDGEPNKRVAAILDVGLRTVEGERAQVMKKLQVASFVQLIKLVSRSENDVSETRKSIFGRILPQETRQRI